MRSLANILLVFVISLIVFSCTKEDITPDPPSNDPVFGAQGTIDGNEISLEAGEDNAYMYTDVVTVNGVDQFRGALIEGDIEMNVNISDGMLDIPELSTDIVGTGIQIAPYNNNPLATLSKSLFPNEEFIDEVTWTIDGVTQPYSEINISEPGRYEICADVIFSNGSTGSTCNTYLIGYQKNTNAVVKYLVGQNDQIISFVESPNNEINEIKWYRNDVLVSDAMTYKDSTSGLNTYSLKARITFANGSFREREIWVNRNQTDYRLSDLSSIELQSNLTWDHKASIEINYFGEKYISFPGSQNQEIIVTNSFEYGTNDDGEKVTYIEGQLNSTFLKVSTQDTVNASLDIRFGIAH
tara:strand:- start:15547 stop:16608 length:1062 start_codon:yes stop_codon:yes gene_type:complete